MGKYLGGQTTSAIFPDWLQVDFSASKTIDEIDVFSGQSSGTSDPTATLTSTSAITDFQVQYWNGSTWAVVPGRQCRRQPAGVAEIHLRAGHDGADSRSYYPQHESAQPHRRNRGVSGIGHRTTADAAHRISSATTGGISTSRARRSTRTRRATSRSSTTDRRRLHPDFGGQRVARQHPDLWLAVRRRRQHGSEESRSVPLLTRKRRREPHDQCELSRSTRFRTRRSRNRS